MKKMALYLTVLILILCNTYNGSVFAQESSTTIIKQTGISRGLVVHLGLTDIELAKSFAQQKGFVVQGLTTQGDALKKMHTAIAKTTVGSQLHVQLVKDYARLPFADHLVNLLLVDLDALAGKGPSIEEIKRAISPAPMGAAWLKNKGKWQVISKPRSKTMGDWTHHRKDPNGNMSTTDGGAVPSGLQWLSGPFFALKGRKNSTQALLTAAGRTVYLTQNVNENIEGGSDEFLIIVRDSFNGLPIWQTPWKGALKYSGVTSFLIVLTDKLLFVVQDGVPVALDAATGKHVRKYSCNQAEQIAVVDNMLVVQTSKGLSVFDVNESAAQWQLDLNLGQEVYNPGWRASTTKLALTKVSVILLNNLDKKLHSFALKDGKKLWQVDMAKASSYRTFNFADQSVIGIVSIKKLEVYSSKDGRLLWEKGSEYIPRFTNLQQSGQYLTDEGIWMRVGRYDWDIFSPETGKIIREFRSGVVKSKNGCQGAILSGNHLVASRRASFFNKKTAATESSITFSRGGCATGMIPANELHYTIPHACGCFSQTVRGRIALRGGHTVPTDDYKTDLVVSPNKQKVDENYKAPWPTFMGNSNRTSMSSTDLPLKMRQLWKKQLIKTDDKISTREWALRVGASLTQAVADEKRLYLGIVNTHQVVAVDQNSGDIVWSYTAEGRVTVPPTLYKGLCLFGDHAGVVHCLHVSDGSLRWRMRAARSPELIMAYGQLESSWPVEGGVLIADDKALFLSGRAKGADGGVTAFAVDPLTGKQLWKKTVEGRLGIAGVLSGDDKGVSAMGSKLNIDNGEIIDTGLKKDKHLQGTVVPGKVDLLDPSWLYMDLSRRKDISDRTFQKGKLLIEGLHIAASSQKDSTLAVYMSKGQANSNNLEAAGTYEWKMSTTENQFVGMLSNLILVNNMIVATGKQDGKPHVILLSQKDGSKIGSFQLPSKPEYMGISASNKRLYISCSDGTLLSYGE
jgi:outer membrane protein assembly factor BamB